MFPDSVRNRARARNDYGFLPESQGGENRSLHKFVRARDHTRPLSHSISTPAAEHSASLDDGAFVHAAIPPDHHVILKNYGRAPMAQEHQTNLRAGGDVAILSDLCATPDQCVRVNIVPSPTSHRIDEHRRHARRKPDALPSEIELDTDLTLSYQNAHGEGHRRHFDPSNRADRFESREGYAPQPLRCRTVRKRCAFNPLVKDEGCRIEVSCLTVSL